MRKIIDQFMWRYQYPFRINVEIGTMNALRAIGVPIRPVVMLVGFRVDDGLRHDICIEPENGTLSQIHFENVNTRADALFVADPETKIIISDAIAHKMKILRLLKQARAMATVEAIEASGALPNMRVFASDSTYIGGYNVHTCIAVAESRIDALYSFDQEVHDRSYVGRSLMHEVIKRCLHRADRALYLPEPGYHSEMLGAQTEDIVREAARTFLDGCVIRAGGQPSDLFNALEAITSNTYERNQAHGRFLIMEPGHRRIRSTAWLERPVHLRDTRAVRKLLEISNQEIAVLIDGTDVFAFGNAAPVEECHDDPPIFEIIVPAHATFELWHNGISLMRVAYGRPVLAHPVLDPANFRDIISRIFDEADTDQLWKLVVAAVEDRHGTTLVISSDATREAQRLGGQATQIKSEALTPEHIKRFSRIDGAILLDTTGVCHAIGVILDGAANGTGDPSRGSRYNSSVRYQDSALHATVVIVVSDDGSVDLVPMLQPRVSRVEVEDAVAAFRSVAASDPVPGEAFSRTFGALERYRFYLNPTQCFEVNSLYYAEYERRFRSGRIAVLHWPANPNPQMNDSYFLSDEATGST